MLLDSFSGRSDTCLVVQSPGGGDVAWFVARSGRFRFVGRSIRWLVRRTFGTLLVLLD